MRQDDEFAYALRAKMPFKPAQRLTAGLPIMIRFHLDENAPSAIYSTL